MKKILSKICEWIMAVLISSVIIGFYLFIYVVVPVFVAVMVLRAMGVI